MPIRVNAQVELDMRHYHYPRRDGSPEIFATTKEFGEKDNVVTVTCTKCGKALGYYRPREQRLFVKERGVGVQIKT